MEVGTNQTKLELEPEFHYQIQTLNEPSSSSIYLCRAELKHANIQLLYTSSSKDNLFLHIRHMSFRTKTMLMQTDFEKPQKAFGISCPEISVFKLKKKRTKFKLMTLTSDPPKYSANYKQNTTRSQHIQENMFRFKHLNLPHHKIYRRNPHNLKTRRHVFARRNIF